MAEWCRYNLYFIILFGKTGCGKSEILRNIQNKGEQVLDLEKLAAHNGSAFGGLGKQPQPTQEEFDKVIGNILNRFKTDSPIWVEYESTYLGTLQIPDFLIKKMSNSKMLIIDLEREERINRIVESYAHYSIDELLAVTTKLKKKLSPKKYRLARKSIREMDFETAVSIFLTYYDKVYENGLKDDKNVFLGELNLKGNNIDENANQVLAFYYTAHFKSRNPE